MAGKKKAKKPKTTPQFDAVVKRMLETKPLKFEDVKVSKKKPGKLLGA